MNTTLNTIMETPSLDFHVEIKQAWYKKLNFTPFSTNQKRKDEALWKKENTKYLGIKPVKKKKR